MTTTEQWDFLNRLTSISSLAAPQPGGGGSAVNFNYSYNSANQRVQVNLADGSLWVYKYDRLGQVTSGKKYWPDWTPVAGQQFEYAFDDIGNRTQTKSGGDEVGQSLRPAQYFANSLNQYTNRDVPGYADITGLELATNSVTVNGQTPYRHGEYFREELSLANDASAVWQSVSVAAPNETTATGRVFVPQTPEVLKYDPDGNLTNDGRWTYSRDAENRLTNMTSLATGPTGSKLKLHFQYDWQGRRIQKTVSTNNGSIYVPQSTNLFVYDGWNLIAELNPAHSAIRTYVWGLDLSGTPQGAGGVGGLLAIGSYGSQASNSFAAFDGNGNVAALVIAATGTNSAAYEYGPFGEVIRATGPMAKLNPFRFSTKYQDDETDLLYYGYRYYNATTGTWLSRDPLSDPAADLGELRSLTWEYTRDALNLYGFLANALVLRCDVLGASICDCPFAFTVGQPVENYYRSARGFVPMMDGGTICGDGKGGTVPSGSNGSRTTKGLNCTDTFSSGLVWWCLTCSKHTCDVKARYTCGTAGPGHPSHYVWWPQDFKIIKKCP